MTTSLVVINTVAHHRVTTLHTKSNSLTFPWHFQYGWRHFIDTVFQR